MKIGSSLSSLEDATFRKSSDPMGESPPLFTGTVAIGLDDTWTSESQIVVSAEDPLPATVLSFIPAYETEP